MEVDIEAIIDIIMSDEKLVDYVNILVRNKLASSRTMNKRDNIANLIDITIDNAFEEIKLIDLVREIKSQVLQKNRVQNRSQHRQNKSNSGRDSASQAQNGKEQSSYSNTKFSSSERRDVNDGPTKILPIYSASEPIPINTTTPKRIVKNMNQTTSMIHSGLSLQRSRSLKEPDSILSDEVTISNHIKQSSVLADSVDVDSENCSVEITGKPTSYSSYLVSSISDESDKKEPPLSFLNSFRAEDRQANKVRESVDHSIDSLDLKRLRFSSTMVGSAALIAASNDPTSAVNQLSSDFRSLVSSTELDVDPNFDVEPVSVTDSQSEELKLKSWEETVSSNLTKDSGSDDEVDTEVDKANSKDQSKTNDPHSIKGEREIEPPDKETMKEPLVNDPAASICQPPKSILCKVSKVKHLDEYGNDDDDDFNAERHVRVNFIPGIVAEVNFRDKVSYLERSTLFYTHDEEFQFTVDINREQERAEEMGMTWMEWIEQRTDEDVQRDEEADKMRSSRRMEDDDGIFPEDQYDDDDDYNNFEDSFGDANNNNNSSSSMFQGDFHPAETQLLMSDDFQVEYDDEIDDEDNNNNTSNTTITINSSHNNSFRNSNNSSRVVGDPKTDDSRDHGRTNGRYSLDESYREDFEFDTEDVDIPEDDDF